MTQPKKLIEVALPVKEVSAESVRDKSIRHGHISTLHLWWARRPLPVCRAVVFASLVPDPLDEHCPPAFVEAVKQLLGGTQYKPYDDIPFTPAVDPLPDNARNRLLMFIGKFSDEFVRAEKQGKGVPAKNQLSDHSLIKWESRNNERILEIARKLIWVAHNAPQQPNATAGQFFADFDRHYDAIKDAEKALYEMPDRHLATPEVQAKEQQLHQAIEVFLNRMPRVFDPFAGGGAIPLEAARLGCRSFGNDLNPVAHIIQKGSLEFPQRYGKPITYSTAEFMRLYGGEELERQRTLGRVFGEKVDLPNRLAHEVEFYAKKLLAMTEAEVGHLYPPDEKGNKPIAYYWARVARCANPACGAEVPLLRQFYLADTARKKVYLKPIISGTKIDFEIKVGKCEMDGWIKKSSLTCPCCGNVTDAENIRFQLSPENSKERLLAVISEDKSGKIYLLPEIENGILEGIEESKRPVEPLPKALTGGSVMAWSYKYWGQLFSERQLKMLLTFVEKLQTIKNNFREEKSGKAEYENAIISYLAILIDRIAIANTAFGIWHTKRETLERIMGRQGVPMVFDYPESNPFCASTGSYLNQLEWLLRYVESEGDNFNWTTCNNASSGEKSQFKEKSISVVVTDPPYYDAIAYADLSDFFYVWLKKTLADVFPLNFAFPQTPKTEECTALKHHHGGEVDVAKSHFEFKLQEIFSAIEYQTSDLVSVMFAHQSTEAWTTLCNSILSSNMNITSSWATDTEMMGALKTDKGYLSSSVTVTCRPSQRSGYGDYREVRQAIEATIRREVKELYGYGFRGADLLTACFGQAVGEFGKYEQVEKPNGDPVTVAELLEMAREAAFNAIVSDIDTDDYTRFYIGWLQLFGFVQAEHDTVRKVTQIGLNTDVNELMRHHLLITQGNKQTLATFGERMVENKNLGLSANSFAIDQAHRLMHLYKSGNRGELLQYIGKMAPTQEHPLWRVLVSLSEVLPSDVDDHRQAAGLLANKESLVREAMKTQPSKGQIQLDF